MLDLKGVALFWGRGVDWGRTDKNRVSERGLEVSSGGLALSLVPAQSLSDRRQRKVLMPCRAALLQTAVLSGIWCVPKELFLILVRICALPNN